MNNVKTILVTGHRGYIGAVLLPKLLEAGYQVRGIDSGLYDDCSYIGELSPVPELNKDIRDVEAADLEGVDAVIHLAGLSNDPLGDLRAELTNEINFLATRQLAELALSAGVQRFVFASSCSVYGASDDSLLNEDSVQNPVTPYAVSKGRSEQALTAMAGPGFSPTYLRASTIYGLSPRIRFDLVVNNLAAWAQATGCVQLKSDGQAWRPVVHVEDICNAYLAVLATPAERTHCRAYNVGITEQNYLVIELAEMVHKGMPGSKLVTARSENHDTRCYRVNCDRIHHELNGYKVKWGVPQAIAQLREAFAIQPVTVEEFEGARYSRLAHILEQLDQGKLDNDLRWAQTGRATD